MSDMKHVIFGNEKIRFDIRSGRRTKTVGLLIRPDATVVILTPPFLDEETIKAIVKKRAAWIIQKQEKIRRLRTIIIKKEFVSGESFPYLGRNYRLKVIKADIGGNSSCKLIGGRFIVRINGKMKGREAREAVKVRLVQWYLERAEEKIADRIRRLIPLVGKSPKKIIIKNQEKRWGSCSHLGVIRFNWKIVMAPLSVMDYVIAHELCHLEHQNHTPEFWNKVGAIAPEYRGKREWLKKNSFMILGLIGES
jgi:predicted metal-dependent hydrolase